MTTLGVDGARTMTNNVAEIEAVLGIEAARTKVMTEIKYIFDQVRPGVPGVQRCSDCGRRHLAWLNHLSSRRIS